MVIRPAEPGDLDFIVRLAQRRRELYEVYQPIFWRVAPDAVEQHRPFLARLISKRDEVGSWVAPGVGYLFCTLVAPPPVYAPGGPSCFVDDFAVVTDSDWATAGAELLAAAGRWGAERGAAQLVVVSAERDAAKAHLLAGAALTVASTWWTGPLS